MTGNIASDEPDMTRERRSPGRPPDVDGCDNDLRLLGGLPGESGARVGDMP
jgi:hypothetical protein